MENACQQHMLADLVDSNQDLIDSYLEKLFPPPKPVIEPPVPEGEGTAKPEVTDSAAVENTS